MPFGQFNIALAKYPLDDPKMAGFTNNINRMNALAERSKGFIWRLDGGTLNTEEAILYNNPRYTWTLSMWETPQDLIHFAYHTIHNRLYKNRDAWFFSAKEAMNVLWPIDAQSRPTLAEATERLEYLRQHGPTPAAFGSKDIANLSLPNQEVAATI